MRKISKLSLVAAVAVAGFSTANAQPLEEAIKNVEVSGSVVYRYDNFHNDNDYLQNGNSDSGKNNYKVGLNLSSKVNDYVKFNSRFIVGQEGSLGFASLDAKDDSDTSVDVELSQAYFGFTAIPNTIVNVGKQGLTTPYTVATDINGNEQTGTGILSLTTVGPVTVALGGFNQTNLDKTPDVNGGLGVKGTTALIDGTENTYVAALMGDLDFVKLEAWYLNLEDTFDTFTLAATGKFDLAENANIGLEARYVQLNFDDQRQKDLGLAEDKNSMFRFAVDGKVSIVNARIAYTKTGKDGGLTALDQDAKNTSLGWAISSNGIADANYWQAALGADILDNLNFTAHYGNLKADGSNKGTINNVYLGGIDASLVGEEIKLQEVYGQLTYKMSKNLTTYVRYGNYEQKIGGDKAIDQDRGRIQVAYTF